MRKVINGKLYDTATAEEICDISGPSGNLPSNDFGYNDTRLYQTKNGAFFVAGEGGATSRWSVSNANSTGGGEGLEPIDQDEAKRLVEQFASVDIFEALFGAPEEA